jgi:putative membrane protein
MHIYEGYNYGGMHLFWWFVWVMFILWIFVTPFYVPFQQKKKNSPLDILKKRFASGEITNLEFQQKKDIL